eukprot:TRINITY_DN24047_c0_g1_i1.p1 TRINITY_DN24047_c0_g1~~TRINITY_DN24047_c0_g1_i1.p1  ORF type:complete len:110 (-),score=1.83 TRINITY_DN24047_c0_g1_i1:11-340(-)
MYGLLLFNYHQTKKIDKEEVMSRRAKLFRKDLQSDTDHEQEEFDNSDEGTDDMRKILYIVSRTDMNLSALIRRVRNLTLICGAVFISLLIILLVFWFGSTYSLVVRGRQ